MPCAWQTVFDKINCFTACTGQVKQKTLSEYDVNGFWSKDVLRNCRKEFVSRQKLAISLCQKVGWTEIKDAIKDLHAEQ